MFKLIYIIGIILMTIIDVFISKIYFDQYYLIIFVLSILIILYYKLNYIFPVVTGLFYLILCPFLLIFNMNTQAEKSGNWTFIFLLIGIIQSLITKNSKDTNDNI